jgi:hypothetical protein
MNRHELNNENKGKDIIYAEEYHKKLEEEIKRDPLNIELTELINTLTLDNYSEVKTKILENTRKYLHANKKLLDILFRKTLTDKPFLVLYAKLCKDLDKELPEENEHLDSKSKEHVKKHNSFSSMIRKECENIIRSDNEAFEKFKSANPDQMEINLKNYILGNTNFICELIEQHLLPYETIVQYFNIIFQKIENNDNSLLKLFNLESFIILLDKFGSLLNRVDKENEEDIHFIKQTDEYLAKLDNIQENDKSIPGYIKYKIINLLEKKKSGWKESKIDQSNKIKSLKEVKEEFENEKIGSISKNVEKLEQEEVNQRIRNDLNQWKELRRKGLAESEYSWEVTNDILNKHKNTFSEILHGFGESCIDFIEHSENIQHAYLYLDKILALYKGNIGSEDKHNMVEAVLFFLENLNDLSLDNNFLVDLWGGVLYLLYHYEIITIGNLGQLVGLNEEQIRCVFKMLEKFLECLKDKNEVIEELLKISFIYDNKTMFMNIIDF